jgi:hypothetical protein
VTSSTVRHDGTVERVGEGRAVFSADGAYRYRLSRIWNLAGGNARVACWIMLNGSKADENVLDPTVRRCVGFSMREGMDGLIVANAFGLVSTDPRALLAHRDPVGPLNDEFIERALWEAEIVVLGWGAHEAVRRTNRDLAVLALVRRSGKTAKCLGRTADGSPRHPLYLRKDAALVEYGGRGEDGR